MRPRKGAISRITPQGTDALILELQGTLRQPWDVPALSPQFYSSACRQRTAEQVTRSARLGAMRVDSGTPARMNSVRHFVAPTRSVTETGVRREKFALPLTLDPSPQASLGRESKSQKQVVYQTQGPSA